MVNVDVIEIEKLKEYASTDNQIVHIDLAIKYKCKWTEASKASGIPEASIRSTIKRLQYIASKMMNPVAALSPTETPAGFSIDRISKHIDKDGVVSGWVIANRDKEDKFEAFKDAWSAFATTMPRATVTEAPAAVLKDLLVDYTIGDAHIGMMAWAAEAGDDWNLEDGVTIMRRAMSDLVAAAPAAETAYVLDVGDYIHSDNMDNMTSKSKNKLDVDGKWANIVKLAVHAMCDLIDMALTKHQTVLYRAAIGNHNEMNAHMMAIAMQMRYMNEPRVVVLDSPAMHNYYQFGCNLLADTHGHTTKPDNLPLLMAVDEPEMWAATTNRIFRTGHVHHLSQKEYPGCTVITYRTLAPKDSWHAGQGYRSNREMQYTVYNRHTGRVGCNFINPSMLGY
jgi:hypothetical protein